MKTAIAGPPRAGKTTLARTMATPSRCGHTDYVWHLGWSKASEHASYWFDDDSIDVIEGVAVPRALRKWLKRNPTGKPCDILIWLATPFVKLSPGQERMGKGCVTVLKEVYDELCVRGVRIEVRNT